tara:strand:- start:250 stop:1245 length:996 start_codon:yes stop_codon:yes gene_type:complete
MSKSNNNHCAEVKDDTDYLTSAREVLKAEATALNDMEASLGSAFLRAIDIISKTKGRVIVSGMGKSGHIGHKIAATLASTGTPAFFVHPGEASHGDLGMITTADTVFILSNSGETSELSDLVAFASRFSIPIISVTSVKKSTLGEAANVALVLPNSPEACPMGLAPTTSTTMMLALGDAIAVSLLQRHQFSAADFHTLHPGGNLGKKFLKVADIMHSGDELPLIPPDITMAEALLVMTAKRFGCVGIIDENGFFLGIITDGDLRRHMDPKLLAERAKDVMTKSPTTISPNVLAVEALSIMNTRSITNLFVLDSNIPIGIIHIHDCLRAGIA